MHDHYLNKFFQKLFFRDSGAPGILLIVLVFLTNLALVMGIDLLLIHNIPLPEAQISSMLIPDYQYPDFSDALGGEALDASSGFDDSFFVLYRSPDGNSYVTKLEGSGLFHRYHWDKSCHILIPEARDTYIHEEGNSVNYLRFTVSNGGFTEFHHREISLFGSSGNEESQLLSIWMVLAVIILLLELVIFNKLRAVFR